MGISMSRHRQDADYAWPAGASLPYVTAALIAANTLLYLRPGALDAHLPRLRFVTFNPYLIIKDLGSIRWRFQEISGEAYLGLKLLSKDVKFPALRSTVISSFYA